MGEEAVLADSGRAGEVAAGGGRVRRLAFLSILRGYASVIPHVQLVDFGEVQKGSRAICGRTQSHLARETTGYIW